MKAQASVEFVLIFMFLLVALIIGFMISFSKTNEVSQSQIKLEADRILIQASNTINTVYLEGPGFSTTVTLPQTILGLNYSMQIDSNRLLLFCNNKIFSKPILTRNVTGNIIPGPNLMENSAGEVLVS